MMLGLTPDQVLVEGKAWIEAFSGVLDLLIVKLGLIIVAGFALRKTWVTQATIEEAKEQIQETKIAAHEAKTNAEQVEKRLDRQGARIDQVAIAVAAPGNGGVVTDTPEGPALRTTEAEAGGK